eukprot:7588723-Alexandrium_andersonii.AAC.1
MAVAPAMMFGTTSLLARRAAKFVSGVPPPAGRLPPLPAPALAPATAPMEACPRRLARASKSG